MSDLESKVLRAVARENRLNLDEQRRYFGTFTGHVVLSISPDDSHLEDTKERSEDILKYLASDRDTLFVKASPKLAVADQCYYMKIVQNLEIQATIVDEKNAHSPYGIIVHSNQAENVDNSLLAARSPQAHDKSKEAPKKGFWLKLFNKD